jgi:electron-transferring-flavoprotein dehydrogenase
MAVDVACVGFGPAVGGFLTTLANAMLLENGESAFPSRVQPGMPLQVICYERADDIGFGVSGVVTRARGIRQSYPDLDPSQIPMAEPVRQEKLLYLLDPLGVSRRSFTLRAVDRLVRSFGKLPARDHAFALPWMPSFLRKDEGMLFSIGQFNQWVGSQLMATGQVQIWPGMPVSAPLFERDAVVGIRLADQGTDAHGNPDATYMPGMDIRAELTVVGDGPVGAVGKQLEERFGLPQGNRQDEWAVGMKMVVELPENCDLEPGTVIHTFGYPEPEIFGFLYVYGQRLASLGIFVPSWFDSPVRTSYTTLQHWMRHPALWRHLKGGQMLSWGAKSLQESGRRGEPHLVGDGYARIGEGSGSTNVLTGSGVDEAWTTGTQLAEGVVELLQRDLPFTRENLQAAYVRRRRESWVESEGRIAAHARNGFQRGVLQGLLGMAVAGLSRGKLRLFPSSPASRAVRTAEDFYRGRIAAAEIESIRQYCQSQGSALHEALLRKAGWPAIPFDGKLLVSHQDALLLGGKVQAPPGYADHVFFRNPHLCETCGAKLCIEACSGQAIVPGDDGGVPRFDREKCVHCGACLWNCTVETEEGSGQGNLVFRAGAGGLHSAVN